VTKQYDYRVAVQTADAFLSLAGPFLGQVGNDMQVAASKAVRNVGAFAASATNMALAVELYFKAAWIACGSEPPANHHLWPLFKGIPNRVVCETIEQQYNQQNQTRGNSVAALELAMSVGPMPHQDRDSKANELDARSRDVSLPGVLKRSNDAFAMWRYLHERAPEHGVRIIQYEFARMQLIAECARSVLLSLRTSVVSS
jgi:hypothetical protein